MYKQGYLEVYENPEGLICIVSQPHLSDDDADSIEIHKSDIDSLVRALNGMRDVTVGGA